jgi:undecaprenyl diphosphate synthase
MQTAKLGTIWKWFFGIARTIVVWVTLTILRRGYIPDHVAFIMDGNRRFAVNNGKNKTSGHAAGLETLKTIGKMCHDLGIHTMTVYAFSIENFKRPKEEVDFIMSLFERVLDDLAEK